MITFTKSQYNIMSKIFKCESKDIIICNDATGGMTNNSVVVSANNEKYIVRLPGEGSDKLVNRAKECAVYNFLRKLDYDNITLYCNDEGFKISKYIRNARTANPYNKADVVASMQALKAFHNRDFITDMFDFNLEQKLVEYENFAGIKLESMTPAYMNVRNRCMRILSWINTLTKKYCLCHIDCNPDNVIFQRKDTKPILIDWEYASMQDPDLDIAMWATYCHYDLSMFNQLLTAYFGCSLNNTTKFKIYGYAAFAGLLWWVWCEYKKQLGVTYGNYQNAQFDTADKYSKLVETYLNYTKKDA